MVMPKFPSAVLWIFRFGYFAGLARVPESTGNRRSGLQLVAGLWEQIISRISPHIGSLIPFPFATLGVLPCVINSPDACQHMLSSSRTCRTISVAARSSLDEVCERCKEDSCTLCVRLITFVPLNNGTFILNFIFPFIRLPQYTQSRCCAVPHRLRHRGLIRTYIHGLATGARSLNPNGDAGYRHLRAQGRGAPPQTVCYAGSYTHTPRTEHGLHRGYHP